MNLRTRSLWVASFTDAWIETDIESYERQLQESHLLQMRGLKPKYNEATCWCNVSHLLQMRGLKHDQGVKYKQVGIVASFTDAWIETKEDLGIY